MQMFLCFYVIRSRSTNTGHGLEVEAWRGDLLRVELAWILVGNRSGGFGDKAGNWLR